ncbi:MAG: DUF1801 domain-containing protein [bacterium]
MSKNSWQRSSNKPPAALIKFLKPYDPAIQDLALRLRALVIEEMAPCHENIYDAYSAVAIGYGWSDRLKDGVFHIAVYTNHVNLGFNHGVSLPDPLGILEGKGNQIRHLKIETPADLTRPEIRSYIRAALKADRDDARKLGEALPPRKQKGGRVISVVKAIYPKKRRPK